MYLTKAVNFYIYYSIKIFFISETLTTRYRTYDATTMVNQIESLTVKSNYDCPEYALSGIAAGNDFAHLYVRYLSQFFKENCQMDKKCNVLIANCCPC